MAEMIQDRLPSGASVGERKVFALLQQLPDDMIVYYEPAIANRYADFVVIIPSVGLLIIEAKGWYPTHIQKANNHEVTLVARGHTETFMHPIRQAREYQYRLMDTARRHPDTAALLQPHGPYAGKFLFPFAHLVVLNNCTREQLDELNLSPIFPPALLLLARTRSPSTSEVWEWTQRIVDSARSAVERLPLLMLLFKLSGGSLQEFHPTSVQSGLQ